MNEQSPAQYTGPVKTDTALLIYILYAAGAFTVGITTIIGVIWAYAERKNARSFLQSHYEYLISTFWRSLLYLFISIVLFFVYVGMLTSLFWVVWLIVRSVKGVQALQKQQPIEKPRRWLF